MNQVYHKQNIQNSRSGQSLLEAMIALFILTTGFLGMMSLLSQSLFLSKTVNNETTATYLASEGIELAKNLIDHDVYNHIAGFGTGWGTCFGAGGSFEIDFTTTDCTTIHKYLGITPTDFLDYDPLDHVYVYSFDDLAGGGVSTIFKRGIKITPIGADEIEVQSIVMWNVGSVDEQSLTLEDYFYNWQS